MKETGNDLAIIAQKEVFTRREAAKWLGVSVATLERMATYGTGGPVFFKRPTRTGRIAKNCRSVYRLEDLRAYVQSMQRIDPIEREVA